MTDNTTQFDADVAIIGAGPCGLFQIFELGIHGLSAIVFDSQTQLGGQCMQLYPHKPIYDIPALPAVNAEELVANLIKQIEPFDYQLALGQEVDAIDQLADEFGFTLTTSTQKIYQVRRVIIATGAGSMNPVRLKVANVANYEGKSLAYNVTNKEAYRDKSVAVLGGGDSALDWALELQSIAAEVILIHRSQRFRAAQHSVNQFMALCDQHQAQFLQGQVVELDGDNDGNIQALKVACADQVVRRVAVNSVLVCFGMVPDPKVAHKWGLETEKHQVTVSTATFETSRPGIFAIGDCNYYPGKKKLILSGFHEAALAAFAIKEQLSPGKKVHLEYTTTSTSILKRLGKAPTEL